MHADCMHSHQLQPLLLAGFFSTSVPPAPVLPPLHPVLELPAPAFSPLQALLLDAAQPLRANVEPVIRPAMQKPARIFFRSFASMVCLLLVKDEVYISPWGRKNGDKLSAMKLPNRY